MEEKQNLLLAALSSFNYAKPRPNGHIYYLGNFRFNSPFSFVCVSRDAGGEGRFGPVCEGPKDQDQDRLPT